MILDDKNYETYIITKVINNYLDKTLSANDEDALNTLLYQSDDLVWKIATEIYSQSGHKVKFSLVRDVANSRIELLKILVAEQKAEQARLKAIAEEQRKAREEAQKAEAEAQRKAREEARRVEEEQRKARDEARKAEEKARFLESGGDISMFEVFLRMKKIIIKELKTESNCVPLDIYTVEKEAQKRTIQASHFLESGKDMNMFEVFLRMKKIIIKELKVEPDCVTPDSNILRDLAADELDAMELTMALENEFALKIPKEIIYPGIGQYCDIGVQKILNFIYEQSLLQK